MRKLYPGEHLEFGAEYILPKPYDHRLLTTVAPAVVRAAMESDVARVPMENLEAYSRHLSRFVSASLKRIRR